MTQGIWFMDVFCSYIQCWFGMNVKVVWNRGPWWTIWPTSKQQVLPEEHRSSPWSWSTYIMLRLQAYSHSPSQQQWAANAAVEPHTMIASIIGGIPRYTHSPGLYVIYYISVSCSCILVPYFLLYHRHPRIETPMSKFSGNIFSQKNCILPLHGSYLKIRYPKIWHVFTAFGG